MSSQNFTPVPAQGKAPAQVHAPVQTQALAQTQAPIQVHEPVSAQSCVQQPPSVSRKPNICKREQPAMENPVPSTCSHVRTRSGRTPKQICDKDKAYTAMEASLRSQHSAHMLYDRAFDTTLQHRNRNDEDKLVG